MRVPTAFGLTYQSSGDYQKDGSRLPKWGIPFWMEDEESEWDDPQVYFWCTKGRTDNDCLHSRRVGVVTGKRVPPVLDANGRKAMWEVEGYFGLPYQDYPFNRKPSMLALCDDHGVAMRVSCDYITLSNPHVDIYASWQMPIRVEQKGKMYRFASGGFSLTAYYNGTDAEPSRVKFTCPSLWKGRYTWPDAHLAEDVCVNALAGVPMYIPSGPNRTRLNPNMISALQDAMPIVLNVLRSFAADARSAWDDSYWTSVSGLEYRLAASYPNLDDADHFIMHEPERVRDQLSPQLIGAGADFSNYWWNVLTQQAYLDCLQSMPRLNDNSISNLIELVGFVKSLVVDRRIEIPKSLQSAWLAYRYQYQTTKLDAKQAIDFVHRHMDLGDLAREISCHGTSRVSYQDCSVTCRCRAGISPKELDTFANIWRALYTYGLQPNFYVVWDMIPYSFVVDWFIPIGNLAAVADARSNYSSTNYKIDRIVFSITYDVVDADLNVFRQYTRWAQGTPPELNGLYFLETTGPSERVVGYRILDALSLTIR
jgi:hypothetical protein